MSRNRTMLPRSWQRNGWTIGHLLWGAALIAMALVATWDAWVDIAWIVRRDEEASHAWLVPIVATWLVWVRWQRLGRCQPKGQWIGPCLIVVGMGLHFYGDLGQYQALWHGGAVLMVVGSILTVVGRDVAQRLLPALIVLVFLVPIPGRLRQSIAIPMETVSAQITQTCLLLVGVTAERSGNLLTIDGRAVAIAEACNGLRMVFALAAVSYAFAFGMPLRGYARALVVLACPISAVLCNVVRLVPTVLLYAYYPGEVAEKFHDLSAWVMLVAAFLLLLATLRLLRWALVPVNQYTLAYD